MRLVVQKELWMADMLVAWMECWLVEMLGEQMAVVMDGWKVE